MKNEIIYKGAYLSDPLFNVSGVPNGERRWMLFIWNKGSQECLMFGQLKFWAKKQMVKQGFSKALASSR